MVEITEESSFPSSIISEWYHWTLEEGGSYLHCPSNISRDLGAQDLLGQVDQSLLSDDKIFGEVRFPEKLLQVSALLYNSVGLRDLRDHW